MKEQNLNLTKKRNDLLQALAINLSLMKKPEQKLLAFDEIQVILLRAFALSLEEMGLKYAALHEIVATAEIEEK